MFASTYFAAGDILLTRNTEEVGNDTNAGYWNHAAIVSESLTVLEAQKEPNAVIEVQLVNFIERYPEILALYHPEADVGLKAARKAASLIGRVYNRWASAFFKKPNYYGENCTSLINTSYRNLLSKPPTWVVPQNIYDTKDDYGFQELWHKKDYEGWTMPEGGWWVGRLQ